MNILSDDFFHLVGRRRPDGHEDNYRILKLILDEQRIRANEVVPGDTRSSVVVDLEKSLANGDLVVPTVTCYCDIPLPSLGFHAKKYGRFGLSFHRDFLIQRGARPVMYMPMRDDDKSAVRGRTLLRDIQGIYRAFRSTLAAPLRENGTTTRSVGRAPTSRDAIIDQVDTVLTFYFLAFLKPYNSELRVDSLHYYYSEREWRMTNHLNFVATDVARVVVAPEYAERLAIEKPEYQGKIVALE